MAYHDIANVEREASVAVFTVSVVLLAGFLTVRFLGRTTSTGSRTRVTT